ncbi:Uncharacterised protein [Mycobacteroides abscessus subsp. abscessus]|nr:Uncharacterised protein [Mycobacteroides abscessus subsp. abscessus]
MSLRTRVHIIDGSPSRTDEFRPMDIRKVDCGPQEAPSGTLRVDSPRRVSLSTPFMASSTARRCPLNTPPWTCRRSGNRAASAAAASSKAT